MEFRVWQYIANVSVVNKLPYLWFVETTTPDQIDSDHLSRPPATLFSRHRLGNLIPCKLNTINCYRVSHSEIWFLCWLMSEHQAGNGSATGVTEILSHVWSTGHKLAIRVATQWIKSWPEMSQGFTEGGARTFFNLHRIMRLWLSVSLKLLAKQ